MNPHIGYEVAAQIAKEAIASGASIRELCLKYKVLTEEQLNLILDPYEMTHPGVAGSGLPKTT
ncbi:Fumarate hydratase class II [compost metagenome]